MFYYSGDISDAPRIVGKGQCTYFKKRKERCAEFTKDMVDLRVKIIRAEQRPPSFEY